MLRIAVFALAAAAVATPASAQVGPSERPTDWPTRPVTMVVTFAAGTAGDVVGRILSGPLGEALGLRTEGGKEVWDCEHDHAHVTRILGEMGLSWGEIEALVEELRDRGGGCDCEIMMNVVCDPEGPFRG